MLKIRSSAFATKDFTVRPESIELCVERAIAEKRAEANKFKRTSATGSAGA